MARHFSLTLPVEGGEEFLSPKMRGERRDEHFRHRGSDCPQALGRLDKMRGYDPSGYALNQGRRRATALRAQVVEAMAEEAALWADFWAEEAALFA